MFNAGKYKRRINYSKSVHKRLTLSYELLLTLMKMRFGLLKDDLAERFG